MSSIRRIIREARADDIPGESSKVAWYLFLSLFPLILTIFALTGFLGGEAAFEWIMGNIRGSVPPDSARLLEDIIRQITMQQQPGALGIGLLLTIWSASAGFVALANGLNVMFEVKEKRSWWKKRALAIGILLASVFLLVGGAAVILAGPAVAGALGLGFIWNLLRWPVAFVLLIAFLWLIYYFLPNRDQSDAKGRILIGAVVGTVVWLIVTAGFRFYVSQFGNYSATYGAIGTVIVLMLWVFLTVVAILFGGEVAAVLQNVQADSREAPARA